MIGGVWLPGMGWPETVKSKGPSVAGIEGAGRVDAIGAAGHPQMDHPENGEQADIHAAGTDESVSENDARRNRHAEAIGNGRPQQRRQPEWLVGFFEKQMNAASLERYGTGASVIITITAGTGINQRVGNRPDEGTARPSRDY